MYFDAVSMTNISSPSESITYTQIKSHKSSQPAVRCPKTNSSNVLICKKHLHANSKTYPIITCQLCSREPCNCAVPAHQVSFLCYLAAISEPLKNCFHNAQTSQKRYVHNCTDTKKPLVSLSIYNILVLSETHLKLKAKKGTIQYLQEYNHL